MKTISKISQIFANSIGRASRKTIEMQSQQLALSVTNLLSLCANDSKSFDANAIQEYTLLFAKSIQKAKKMTIKDIDNYIDWLYISGYIIPSFEQYRQIGMFTISSCTIFVPIPIQASIPDWRTLKERAINAGLLLTTCDYAPKHTSWEREFSQYIPGLFDMLDQVSFLERLVQFAEEALEDRAPLPEFVARISEVSHIDQASFLKEIDCKIERLLRNYASILDVPVEVAPEDIKELAKRIHSHQDRYMAVHNWRTQNLISDEMKRLANFRKLR